MGWLSLATRVIPKLWRSGVKVTSTLWKGGSSVVGAVAKNPKTTAVASLATFAGWQKLSHPDESIGTAVGKTLRGGTDGTGDFAHDVVNGYTGENTVEQVKDTTNKVISEIKDTAAETKGLLGTFGDTLKGISSFIGNLFGGNGTNMFGNFFNNLASGKISGWGNRCFDSCCLYGIWSDWTTGKSRWRIDGHDDDRQQLTTADTDNCPSRKSRDDAR